MIFTDERLCYVDVPLHTLQLNYIQSVLKKKPLFLSVYRPCNINFMPLFYIVDDVNNISLIQCNNKR